MSDPRSSEESRPQLPFCGNLDGDSNRDAEFLALNPLEPPPHRSGEDSSQPRPPAPPRCRAKGCIFPVHGEGETRCAHHQREECEPKLFLSLQPSNFLLDQAKFGVPEKDYDYSRARDRRRLAVQREARWDEVA